MTSAKEINEKLDAILLHHQQVAEVHKEFEKPNFELKHSDTGKTATKEDVLNKADEIYNNIICDLNSLTSGRSVKDMFTNIYYVNDLSQDKQIAKEIRANKLKEEEDKQNPNSN